MKKNLSDMLTDGKAPTEKLITDEMTYGSDAGMDIDRVMSLTLQKAGIAPKKSFFRTYYKQFSAIAACLVLAVGVFAAYRIWGDDTGFDVPNSGTDDFMNAPDNDVIWGEPDGDRENEPNDTNADVYPNVPEGVGGDDDNPDVPDVETDEFIDDIVGKYEYTEWNGLNVSTYLAEKFLSGAETDVYAIRVENGSFVIPDDYVYEGQTYAELKQLRNEYYEKSEKLWDAFKAGYGLIYGETSYTSGTPDGEKWTEEYYNEMLDEYGEEYRVIYDRFEEILKEKENLSTPPEADFGLYWSKYGEAATEELYKDLTAEHDHIGGKLNRLCGQYYAEHKIDFGEGSEFYETAKANGITAYSNGSSFSYIFATSLQLEAMAKELSGQNLLYIPASEDEFRYYFNEDGSPVNHDTTDDSVTDAPSDFVDEVQIPSDDAEEGWGTEKDTEIYIDVPVPDTAEPVDK